MLELAVLVFLGMGFAFVAFGTRRRRAYPWWFGTPICPLCRKLRCYGVDSDCKVVHR